MVEIPFDAWDDSIKEIPEPDPEDAGKDFIFVPQPLQNKKQIKANLKRNKLVDI